MSSIGDYLRRVREEKNIPVAQVSRDTKINQRYIEAIEADEFLHLPAPAYAKGFVKIYASYLGIDPEPVIEQFLREHVGFSKQSLSIEGDSMATGHMLSSWRYTALGVGAAIVIVILLVSLVSLFRSCARPTVDEFPSRMEDLETLPVPPLPTEAPEGEPAGEEPAAAEGVEQQKMKLVARAKRNDVWVKVLADGVLLFQGTIPKGKEEYWLADEKIHLRMGKPDMTELLLDGKPIEDPTEQNAQNLIVERGGKFTFYKGKMKEE